jgi:hypothetical protein
VIGEVKLRFRAARTHTHTYTDTHARARTLSHEHLRPYGVTLLVVADGPVPGNGRRHPDFSCTRACVPGVPRVPTRKHGWPARGQVQLVVNGASAAEVVSLLHSDSALSMALVNPGTVNKVKEVMLTHMRAHMHTHTHASARTYTHTNKHAHTRTYTHTHTHTRMHVHAHKHKHTQTHTLTGACMCKTTSAYMGQVASGNDRVVFRERTERSLAGVQRRRTFLGRNRWKRLSPTQ